MCSDTLYSLRYHRILNLHATADMDAAEHIKTTHLTEAITYRKLDRL